MGWLYRLALPARNPLDLAQARPREQHALLPCALQFIDHPAAWCYKLPDNLSHEEGAMCEPLSGAL